MEEVLNAGVVLEDTQVQTDSAIQQTISDQETIAESSSTQEKSQPDQQDNTWIKKLRRDRDNAIRDKQDLERKNKMQEELMRQMMSQQQVSNPVQEEDILQSIQKEEYVPGEKVARAIQMERERNKKEVADLRQEFANQQYKKQEAEIRSTYADYDEVVNPDTIDILKETNPRLAQRVLNLLKVDPMDGAIFAYESINAAGIVDKIPGARRVKEVEKKLEQSKKTIQSPVAYDKRPLAQAFREPETKKEKEALWHETLKYASMSGGGF